MRLLTAILGFTILIAAGCGSGTTSNSNNAANQTAPNGMQNVDPRDLPPGLSASPVQPASNTNAVNSVTPGSTPTPGIPDPKGLNKPAKPGATPTPGIPDEETIKRQMDQMKKAMNSNITPPPPPGAGDGQMMRKKPRATNSNN